MQLELLSSPATAAYWHQRSGPGELGCVKSRRTSVLSHVTRTGLTTAQCAAPSGTLIHTEASVPLPRAEVPRPNITMSFVRMPQRRPDRQSPPVSTLMLTGVTPVLSNARHPSCAPAWDTVENSKSPSISRLPA